MDTFLNFLRRLRCQRHNEESGQHGEMYESAFTYNTEREFSNVYQNIDRDYSSIKNEDERIHLEELRQHSTDLLSFISVVELLCATLSFIFLVCTLPFSLFFCLKFIPSFERIVVFRMGKILKVAGPGTILVLPCVDKAIKIDIRTNTIQIPPIQLISSDKGIIEIESVIFIKVNDPVLAVCTLHEHGKILRNMAYTNLYNQFVRLMVSDICSPNMQSKVTGKVNETLNTFIRGSGVEVTEVTIANVNVVKQGENQTIPLFQQLLSSDVGKQLIGALGAQAAEILSQGQLGSPGSASSSQVSFSTIEEKIRASMSSASTVPVGQEERKYEYEVSSNATLDILIEQIRQCCDSNLVAKIGKFYRIQCELDGRIYTIDLNLQCGDGYCGLAAPDVERQPPSDVTFSLSYTTLISLIKGEISPVSAFLNGNVKISGSVEDAMALNHLAARARELNLKLM